MTAQDRFAPGSRILDRYEIVRHIATGGMGTVWEARDLALDQPVALKRVSFAALPGQAAEETRQRTLREARFAAQLRGHQHVVSIYDVQVVEGDVWLVLEYLPSHSLADVTDQGRTLPAAEVARIGAAVADALAAAHGRGITHRDVKPGNVLLGQDGGQIKLTDFGISHAEGEHPVTALDVISGTPAYMAREVARGDPETPASDIFSLGSTLYKAIEGRPPYGEDTNSRRMLQRVANGQVDPPQRAGQLTPLLMYLLEPDPQTRPDAAQAARLLDDFSRRFHDPTRPPVTAVAGPPSGYSGPHTPPPSGPYGTPGPASGPGMAPPPSGQTPPPRRRRRWPLVAGALVLVAALVVGTVLFVNRPDPTAIPALPDSASPAAVDAARFRAADPCALFDQKVMSRYGPSVIGAGVNISECRITSTPPGGAQQVYNEAHYATTDSELVPDSSIPRRELGGLTIVPLGNTTSGCSTILIFGGTSMARIDTRNPTNDHPAPNLCQINEAAVAVAVNHLADDGVQYTPGWQHNVTMLNDNPCLLPGDSLNRVPGLDVAARAGKPNGAACYIGQQSANTPYVTIALALESQGSFTGYGTPGKTPSGKGTYTSRGTPLNGNPASCEVYVVHKPSYDGGASGPAEAIYAAVEGPQPFATLCKQAADIGTEAESHASK